MEGMIVRIAALAALACGVPGVAAPASAAAAGLPDAQSAVSVVQQHAAAIAAPDAARLVPSPPPVHSSPDPARAGATQAPRPAPVPAAVAPAATKRPAHVAQPRPKRPRAAPPRPSLERHPGAHRQAAPARAHARRLGDGVPARQRPARERRRDRAPLRLPGAMGASTGTVPGPDTFAAALLVALLAASLPRLLRPLDDLRLAPQAAAFVSAIDRPG